MADLKTFIREVNDFKTKVIPEDMRRFQLKLALELLTRTKRRNPVDTGRSRAAQ